jgi:hypothetical protein
MFIYLVFILFYFVLFFQSIGVPIIKSRRHAYLTHITPSAHHPFHFFLAFGVAD